MYVKLKLDLSKQWHGPIKWSQDAESYRRLSASSRLIIITFGWTELSFTFRLHYWEVKGVLGKWEWCHHYPCFQHSKQKTALFFLYLLSVEKKNCQQNNSLSRRCGVKVAEMESVDVSSPWDIEGRGRVGSNDELCHSWACMQFLNMPREWW